MISSINSSLSGMQAAFKLQDNSANNVANIQSNGFKKDVSQVVENANGGVIVSLSRDSSPGPAYEASSGQEVEGSNVDLSQEMTAQISNKQMLSVNIAAFKTTDEMQKSILDIIA